MIKEYLRKEISTPIAIGIILVLVILVGGFTWWQYSEIRRDEANIPEVKAPEVELSEKEVLAIADVSNEALLLDKIIQLQNKFSDCIDEIAKIYPQQGLKQPTPETIEKTKRCKSFIEKDVTKINESTYLVKYTQGMPDNCTSVRTTSDLLNVEVNIDTKETIGIWPSGVTFSDTAIQDIEKTLELDCESYAQYLGSHGKLYSY